jgi:molybdate-binding protein
LKVHASYHNFNVFIGVMMNSQYVVHLIILANLHRELKQSDFQHVEWILREEGSGTREVFDNAILKDLEDANIRLTLGHNEAILKIVAGG